MKLELKIKLAEYETLGIQTNEYNTGINEQNLLCCIDEIILILNIHSPFFPKQISNYLNKYEHMRTKIINGE